ncbi:hypothetical protein [Pseudomonas putida]|uniref:hypothetical protein n=1 Tax=Pseudomonas putida TaxID=303 RepID=UPI0018ABE74F|nr:hypothetical protein [Pseudomonas putida]MBF8726132.1 hypothetical protein [Pseudomonas putida]
MSVTRFDSTVKSLTDNWEFELLVEFYQKHATECNKQLEFCVLLADLGMLDRLHAYIRSQKLYNLKDIAEDPDNTYSKSKNARLLLDIYESDMLPCFERLPTKATGHDANLLRMSLFDDISVVDNYISQNSESLFEVEQNPKTLMYLTFALNQVWKQCSRPRATMVALNGYASFKNLSAIRRAYLTKKITVNSISFEENISFPQLGYNELQKLLGAIAPQKARYEGASKAYRIVSQAVLPQLQSKRSTKMLGSDVKPRVAVCISGVHRCGSLALESIFESIVRPLQADTFLHSWSEMQNWPGLGGAGDEWIIRAFNKDALAKCPEPLKSKRYFKEKFPRTFKALDTPSYSSFDISNLPEGISFTGSLLEDDKEVFQKNGLDINDFLSLGLPNQAKMIYGIYKAHELAVLHEKKHGFRYDYVIRCRPDVALVNKLSFADLNSLRSEQIAMEFTKEWGPQDQFWYGQREPALKMASLWTASVESKALSPFPMIPQMRAHNLVLGWMTESMIEPTPTPIRRNMNLVNSQATPPNFSASLLADLQAEAKEYADDQKVREFFTMLMRFSAKA